MPDALVVTVRLLGGAYHGTGDWPPAPARLFQALIAGAARGRHISDTDRAALLWLERLPPPTIAAPAAVRTRTPTLFVPNNDLDAKGGDPARIAEVRVGKRTERRRIDRPAPILYVFRGADPPDGLADLAARLYRLGRGDDPAFAFAELVASADAEAQLAAHPGMVHVPAGGGAVPIPVPGTLASLEQRFAMTLERFVTTGTGRKTHTLFAQPPKARFGRIGYDTPPRRLSFEIVDGERFVPVPLERAGALVDGLRKAAAARLATPEADRLIVGRGAGSDDLSRRVLVLPVPSIGHAETDPSIRRVEVLVPAMCPIPAPDVAWAFAGLSPMDPETGEIGAGTLVAATDPTMGARYRGPARRWRSITALALSAARRRIPPEADGGGKGGEERQREEDTAAEAVRASVAQAGVRATPVAIAVRREPFGRRESMAEAFAAGTRFGKHALWHADVTFDRPVTGPIAVGDGRFTGLGLMRPVAETAGGWALAADRALPDAADDLARALRRAVMACAREVTGSRDLPPFFSGHAEDGTPLREGARHHVSTLTDPTRRRFLVLAPHLLERREPTVGEAHHLAELAAVAQRLATLVAGRHGVLALTAEPLAEDDVLLAPARIWRSLSPYVLTRRPRRAAAALLVAEDVAAECRRRALPTPAVEVLAERPGLAFTLRLSFPRVVVGPILLGRTNSRGGLFGPEDT